MSSLLAFALLLVGLTLAALVVGDGAVLVSLAPGVILGTAYAVARLPLRYSVVPLSFLALTLENPSDVPAAGLWRSPLYAFGTALLAHLNLTFPTHAWLFFSGLDIALVYLFAIALVRRAQRSRIDRVGRGAGAPPMRTAAFVCLAGAAWIWLWGAARGGSDIASSLWQVQRVVYLPIVYLLFELTLRGPADRAVLGKVLILAACVKAVLAIYLRATLEPPPGAAVIDYATTHADSMLFADAFGFVCAGAFVRLDKRSAALSLCVLPVLVAGMVANHRRLVWIEVAAGLAAVLVLSPWTRPKRAVARAAILAAPFVLVYAALGWSSTSDLFAPVHTLRSVIDSTADASTEWRDWENYNLFFTLRQNPIFGTGYGHGYGEAVKLPAISQVYSLYRFIPHNSILGLWTYGGIVGFTALWGMMIVGLFFSALAARRAASSGDRIAGMTASVTIVVYLVHCYGDMGLGTWTSVFTVAPALAVASRLAVATGAWHRGSAGGRAPVAAPARWVVSGVRASGEGSVT